MPSRPRIGVSACLLGQEVRYDGGHKRNADVIDVLGPQVEWVPVCPEVEFGMGTPREPLRLVRDGDTLRMVTVLTNIDYTERMVDWARQRVSALEREDLDGYILKSDSPSCGMEQVLVFSGFEAPSRDGRGLFADVLISSLPRLPVEEEKRLADPRVRAAFMQRVLAYRRQRSARRIPK
jgi:uncharacterized protein YbbK (DUF523 family)